MHRIKIMHAADLHLGARLPGLGDKATARRNEILRSFFHMLEICASENVDYLLLAGDFLESSEITEQQIQAIRERIAEAASLKILITPGNHDYMAPDSPYASSWPENVHIFCGACEALTDPEKELVIYGAGFSGTYQERSLLTLPWEEERKKTPGYTRLLVVHGDWNQPESPYHPILPEALPPDFFTYVALGHVHKRSPLQTVGHTTVAYSGCPDGTGFDETGVKGVYLGTVEPMHCDLHFRALSTRLFVRQEVDGSHLSSQREAEERLMAALQEAHMAGFDDSNIAARLLLTGAVDEKEPVDWALLQETLREKLYWLEIRDLRVPALDWEQLKQEESLKGYFAAELYARWKKAAPEERETLERALRFGLEAFNGKDWNFADLIH